MNNLIKVETTEQGTQQVSARELRKALGTKNSYKFSDWFKKNSKGFVEGEDFQGLVVATPYNRNSDKVQKLQDYLMTLDMAKHIAMMSGTENGHKIRNYFIEVEKEWNSPELMMARSLNYANNKLIAYQKQQDIDAPKVEGYERFIATGGAIGIREAAKELEVKVSDLRDNLLNHGYVYYTKGRHPKLQPYRQYVPKWFVLKSAGSGQDGVEYTPQMKITPKGREHFYKLFYAPDQTELDV